MVDVGGDWVAAEKGLAVLDSKFWSGDEGTTDAEGFGVRGVLGTKGIVEPRTEHLVPRPLRVAVEAGSREAQGEASGTSI